jgi:hypothetical protein
LPFKKNHRRRIAIAACTLAAGALLPAAAEAASCAPVPTSTLFSAQGDLNTYFVVDGGDFEGPSPWRVDAPADPRTIDRAGSFKGRRSLVIRDGATATSPGVCVDPTRTHLRFGVDAADTRGRLTVTADDGSGPTVLATLDAADFRDWSLSPIVPLATALGVPADTTRQVSLRFVAAGGAWAIDAVAVDPRRAG